MKSRKELLASPHAAEASERLIRYAKIETTSNSHIEAIPSTETQWDLARLLEQELKQLGIQDISLDEHCYLIARLPASPGRENSPCIGLMAHMDTASDVSGRNVRPRLISDYDGKPIELGPGYVLAPDSSNPALSGREGDTIIVTDGSTLLGADDKAGIAEIMSAVSWLVANPQIPHGPLEIIFTPDEETGKGMNLFPKEKLRSRACYTLDGYGLGEIECECFNAYTVIARFTGRSMHIGQARGRLANAVSMASSFVSMLPQSESPEATDGWYGYYCAHEISGGLESAQVKVFLRDFSDEGMKRRIDAVGAMAKAVEAQYPLGSVELDIKKSYVNMRRKLDERPEVTQRLIEAARRAGLEPYSEPIRGGTDGARLTELGIPTPNMFTGAYNCHSRFEWASVSEMVLAVETILQIIALWAEA